MTETIFHEDSIETEVRDGRTVNVLVIATEGPVTPELPGDAEDIASLTAGIRKTYEERGITVDDVRLIPWSQRKA